MLDRTGKPGSDRRWRHDARPTRAGGAHRRLESIRLLVPLVVAGIAIPAAMGLAQGHSGGSAHTPTLSVGAADTPEGVRYLVRGEGFTPGSSVQLSWGHPETASVTAVASSTGEVIAGVPDMQMSSGADMTLSATDGVHVVSTPVNPLQPAVAVLGATSTSRVLVNGSPYFLLGADYPWQNYGNDFGSNAWGSYGVHAGGSYAADFADMKAKGVHVARWWMFADGRAGINWAADGTPAGVQQVVYDDLNQALALAQQNNIYLDLVLFDVSLLGAPNVYSGVQMGGHSDAIANATKRAALVNNVVMPLAKAYANNPMILSWELMNEPEWGISNLPGPAVNANYTPVTMAQFWGFASSASQIIHFYAGDSVTIGSAALKWNKVWTDTFATSKGLPPIGLDFYQTHYYQWMDCCTTTNDPDLGTTTWSPLTQTTAALGLDKPIVVGEIHTPAGSAGSEIDAALANGYAGFWGWSYNSASTGDHLQIDWSTFTPWEAAHASIVRIPPPSGSSPTASPSPAASTATATTVPATSTARPSTSTPAPAAPSATKTAAPTARPKKHTPTTTRTATASVPSSTPTVTKTAATVASSTPTATKVPSSTPTATRVPSSTPTATKVPSSTPTPTPLSTSTPAPTSTPGSGPAVPVNFGVTLTSGVNDTSDMGYLNGSPATLISGGTLASLSVYVGQVTPGARIRLALYANGSNGNPYNLLAQTGEGTAVMGWNTMQFSSGPWVGAGTYWIAAQTNDPNTVYRMVNTASPTDATGWSPQAYGAFPSSTGPWTSAPGEAFSMFGTVMSVPANEPTAPIATPTYTAVPTPTATPAMGPMPTPTQGPMPTPTQGSGSFDAACAAKLNPAGATQCGEPRNFCDTWAGGFCDDFRREQTTTHSMFPMPGEPYTVDMFSTTGPQYIPVQPDCCHDGGVPVPEAFTMYEHLMMGMADSNFGDATLRLHQPFDFSGRTGHIHFDVDLKTGARRYVRLMLSRQLTKRGSDDRRSSTIPYPPNAYSVYFVDGGYSGTILNNGCPGGSYCLGGAYSLLNDKYRGHDNVRDHVDVYVNRTHTRIVVNGITRADENTADIGFDRAYVYFEQASYNECKDGPIANEVWPNLDLDQCTEAASTFHWDNIAFDGPVLPTNSLTPVGSEDVLFNAYSVSTGFATDDGANDGHAGMCKVKGVNAAPVGPARWGTWVTWAARLPAGAPVTVNDITCQYSFVDSGSDAPRGLEVVSPGG